MAKEFRPKLLIKNYIRCVSCNRNLDYELFNESYASTMTVFPENEDKLKSTESAGLMEFYIDVERCDCQDVKCAEDLPCFFDEAEHCLLHAGDNKDD